MNQSQSLAVLSLLPSCLALGLALPSLASNVCGQRRSFEATPIVVEGARLGGFGTVDRIGAFGTNSEGDWYASVTLRDPSGVGTGTALLHNGDVLLQGGDPVPGAPGLSVSRRSPLLRSTPSFDRNGTLAVVLNVERPGEDGVLYGTQLVVQDGQSISSPQVPAGTRYRRITHVEPFRANGLLVLTDLEDSLGTFTGTALIELELDERGLLERERIIAKSGDLHPQHAQPISRVTWGVGNERGDVLFRVLLEGTPATPAEHAIHLNDDAIAVTGTPSVVPGRSWLTLGLFRTLALDDVGNYAYLGLVDGDVATNDVIVRNGVVFRQEGSLVSAESPFAFTAFAGNQKLALGNNGLSVFRAKWNDPDPSRDEGLLSSWARVVQEGGVIGEGRTITLLHSYELSPNGRFLTVHLRAGSTDALVLFSR